ncbi:redoxin domain-containing protein [Patescibacteria group bacterium]|nr:redoxin domain-containing protein [Patescibacteria group bacterium]
MTHNSKKAFATSLIITIVALILVVGGVFYFSTQNKEEVMMDKTENEVVDKEEVMMDKTENEVADKEEVIIIDKTGDEVVNKEEVIIEEKFVFMGKVLAGSQAPLLEFNKADYDQALASDKLVVLYFYADWCPICKQEVVDALYPAFNKLTTDQVIGIQVNYKDNYTDSDEVALAREFGVPYQHTKVFLKDGKRVLKSPETWDMDRYASEIAKYISN